MGRLSVDWPRLWERWCQGCLVPWPGLACVEGDLPAPPSVYLCGAGQQLVVGWRAVRALSPAFSPLAAIPFCPIDPPGRRHVCALPALLYWQKLQSPSRHESTTPLGRLLSHWSHIVTLQLLSPIASSTTFSVWKFDWVSSYFRRGKTEPRINHARF